MLFYRVEIEFPNPAADEVLAFLDRFGKSERGFNLNAELRAAYEEGRLGLLLQLTEADAERRLLLAFAVYDRISEGVLDLELTVREARKAAKIPAGGRMTFWEVGAAEFDRAVSRYHQMDCYRLREKFGWDCFRASSMSGEYELSERLTEDETIRNRRTAKSRMKRLLPDAALAEEVDRIFSAAHPRDRLYGIPVHYKLSVRDDEIADDMVDFIIQCLHANNRLLSRRVVKIDKIQSKHWSGDDFSKVFKCSQYSAVQIMLSGDVATEEEYASQYHQISDRLAEAVKKNAGNTLFFFIENTAHPGFARQLLEKISDQLDVIEINEGVGNAREASAYFRNLAADSTVGRFYKGDILFEEGKFYSASKVRDSFERWRKEILKSRIYRSYDRDLAPRIGKADRERGSAFEELQSMVGLAEVKGIMKDIIAAHKVRKLRGKYYDPKEITTSHMVFMGNPGTAKTTVARLLTEIMKENGVLTTGTFIECGRSELVGKYMGWTAQLVKEKFKQARGGILFIDEAYSLAEGRSGLYGDEAINTIVQEMENKRGDTIVIFAGYPEKMKDFLARNEGLRSRIAFHVDFPDYTPEELMGILEKILHDKRYVMTPEAKDKAMDIFRRVYRQEEYGNGRFVRNLFEQAVNRQASRLLERAGEELDRETLFELQAADLDTNIAARYEKKNRQIGFAG